MKKVGKILLGILEIFIIVYVIAITTCLLCKNKYGYTKIGGSTLVTVNVENSVELTDFSEGDLIIFKEIRYNSVEVGDAIYYYDTLNDQYIIRKGIVESKEGDNRSAVYVLDDDATIASERVVGSFKGNRYASVGSILDVLESRFGFLLIVILPILLLFIYQVYKMVVLLKFDSNEEK